MTPVSRLPWVTSVLIALAAGPVCALTVTVDWTGAGDYLTLPEAIVQTGPADTVLIAPGVYTVGGAGWPIVLNAMSPSIVGRDGAEVTVLQGTGTETAFTVNATVRTARRYVRGLTFRNLAHLIYKPSWYEGGPLVFTDNVVEYCTGGLDASSCWCTSPVVARNVIRYSGSVSLYANSGIFEHNEVSHCSGGVLMYYHEFPTIRYNYIHHSGTGIITGASCDVQDNVIEDNATLGIWLENAGLVQGNIIRRNGTGIRVGYMLPSAQVRYNDIYDNGCNLRITTHDDDNPWQLNASPNWWGTTDPVQIAATIWDCHDDGGLNVCVAIEPWCAVPGCGTSPVRAVSWGAVKALFR